MLEEGVADSESIDRAMELAAASTTGAERAENPTSTHERGGSESTDPPRSECGQSTVTMAEAAARRVPLGLVARAS
ncbi:hypothetical protein NQ854_04885 [Rhodococcus ruber]|uniref:hypothetical protein n=1 Tax=Rhodococcus TaxID=1827 RepID=UPI00387DD314